MMEDSKEDCQVTVQPNNVQVVLEPSEENETQESPEDQTMVDISDTDPEPEVVEGIGIATGSNSDKNLDKTLDVGHVEDDRQPMIQEGSVIHNDHDDNDDLSTTSA